MKISILNERLREYITLIMFFLFGIILFIVSSNQPDFGQSNQSPGIFPAIVAVVMILISGTMLIVAMIKLLGSKSNITRISGREMIKEKKHGWEFLISLILIIVYVLLIGNINFFIDTFLFITILMLVLKAGNIKKILLLSLSVVVLFKIIFEVIFKVFLP
jgi:hypothetical protein